MTKFGDTDSQGYYPDDVTFNLLLSTQSLKGDVNGDGAVDVADIATVISVMSGSADVSSATADVNGDGTVDIADIVAVINIIAANARKQNTVEK